MEEAEDLSDKVKNARKFKENEKPKKNEYEKKIDAANA